MLLELRIINFISQLLNCRLKDVVSPVFYLFLTFFHFIKKKKFISLIAYLRKSLKTLTQLSMKIFKIKFLLSLLSKMRRRAIEKGNRTIPSQTIVT